MINHSGTTPNEWRYEGEQYDQGSGLYDLRARWMDPGVGRFTSRDTFSGTQTDPISLHPYLYTADDPINRVDPMGHFTLDNSHGEFLSIDLSIFKTLSQRISSAYLFLSDLGEKFIKSNEGRRLKHATSDKLNKTIWNIGWSHRIYNKQHMKPSYFISKPQAQHLFDEDVINASEPIQSLSVPLHQYEFDALVDFVYNIGKGNFEKSEAYQILMTFPQTSEDYLKVSNDFFHFTTANHRFARGLFNRRMSEQILFDFDSYYINGHFVSGF
jgi:RHS repeat-associated protein